MDERYTRQYEEIRSLFVAEQFEDCCIKAKALLTDLALPRYFIIRINIKLACVANDDEEAELAQTTAIAQWRIAHSLSLEEGEDYEAVFASLGSELENLKKCMNKLGLMMGKVV